MSDQDRVEAACRAWSGSEPAQVTDLQRQRMARALAAADAAASKQDANPAVMLDSPQPVLIEYINWRDEIGFRRILPHRIMYGSTEWHPNAQWLLEATDLDKNAERIFALGDITEWESIV